MADNDGEGKHRSSPREDFNPLEDDIKPVQPSRDQEAGEDADCSDDDEDGDGDKCVSLEGELESYFQTDFQYGTTPPISNARQQKRERSRSKGSYRDYKQHIVMDKKQRDKVAASKPGVVNIIKARYAEKNPLLAGLTSVDSDDNLDRGSSREQRDKKRKENREKSKTQTKALTHDRITKRHSGDLAHLGDVNTAPLEVPVPVNRPINLSGSMNLSGSGRFSSLVPPKPIVLLSPVSGDRGELRRPPAANKLECPKERYDFYKTFSVLINMGSHGKKDKEKRDKVPKRNISYDEEMLQTVKWIGLQAWLNGLAFKDQENDILAGRDTIPVVLDEILNFKCDLAPSVDLTSDIGQVVYRRGTSSVSQQSFNTEEDSVADVSVSYQTTFLTSETIAQQHEALEQVQHILDKLDKCENLFPTTKAFAKDYPIYGQDRFVHRTKSLYLWLNITRDLCHKLRLLKKMLNLQNLSSTEWPTIDTEILRDRDSNRLSDPLHRLSVPEIRTVENTSDEEENGEGDDAIVDGANTSTENPENKKVTFSIDSAKNSRNPSPSRNTSPVDGDSPQDTSTPLKPGLMSSSNLSRASSEASLEESNKQHSIYRSYVDKSLKKIGLSKMLIRLRDVLDRTLQRAKDALERPRDPQSADSTNSGKTPPEEYYHQICSSPSLDFLDKNIPAYTRSTSLVDYGAWSEQFIKIGLPSFRPTYLFLVRVMLDIIHEAMKIRLEQLETPQDPSFLSIRQLIRECKDVLSKAVLVKQYYQHMVAAVLADEEMEEQDSPMDLEHFDNDMASMFKIYHQYLQAWLIMLQTLPESSRSLQNPLEEEWSFTKKICPHVVGGEAEAGKRFSTLAISLLNSIADFLDQGIDEYATNLYDWTIDDDDDNYDDEDDNDDNVEKEDGDDDEDEDEADSRDRASQLRHSFQQTCRNFKNLFHEARERASKALGFAKMLRKDLEIAADFNIAVTTVQLLAKLKETNHIRVRAPLSAGYLMFIPEKVAEHRALILQLLNVTCGREDVSPPPDTNLREDGYLLMVRCGGGKDRLEQCPVWTGSSIQVEPTAETVIALTHIQVEALLLVVIHSSQLSTQRKDFEGLMGDTVELVYEQTSCHQAIAESLMELKEAAISLRETVAGAIKRVDEKWNFDDISKMEEHERNHILKLYRETMLQAYNFGFEYMKEVTRLVSGESRQKLGKGLIQFAEDWMKFVSEKCERGRGMRPRWANQGLDFLTVACDPKILALLTEDEFGDLQKSINDFISHLIGSAEKTQPYSPTHVGLPMTRSVANDLTAQRQYNRFPSWPAEQPKVSRSTSSMSTKSDGYNLPNTAPAASNPVSRNKKRSSDSLIEVDLHDGDDGGIVLDVHRRSRVSSGDLSAAVSVFNFKPRDRITRAIKKLETEADNRMREKRVVGQVLTHRKSEVSYHINVRKVNFRWHRGNKIGEGQFGKVYCAVNIDTGELMAMKELKFQANDMQAFKEIIDEIKIFEGIKSENLVRYYGVEVHRDEMLVFMEYCDRGTIEEVSRVGLPEAMIRYYTRELLIAVNILHEHGIVHRDIKGANIFLTSSGRLKLGDFGCSVKLKNHSTMAGEVNKLVGTTAYMAPEVITRTDGEGHGRAADIWSLGCVVIEMASGKRPWHELENNYQIMFKVGMGETPPIPDNLSPEGKNFLSHCLEQEATDRWTANQLQDHPFAKVYEDAEGEELA